MGSARLSFHRIDDETYDASTTSYRNEIIGDFISIDFWQRRNGQLADHYEVVMPIDMAERVSASLINTLRDYDQQRMEQLERDGAGTAAVSHSY